MSNPDKIERVDRLVKAGEPGRAFDLASDLLRESPNDAELWALRGHLSANQADYDDAISDLSHAIRINELEPDYFFTRGRYRLVAQDYRGAADDFTHTLRLCDRHASDYYREVAYFFRAEAFLCLKMYDEARADCDHVRDNMKMWTTMMRSKRDILDACNRRHGELF